MKTTSVRQLLVEQDKLGRDETFEARIRGALSPYATLIEMISSDRFDPVKYKEIIANLADRQHLDKILELLKYSEEDREELCL